MEQQKLLWIIFALATGVLVVVAAAFILFVPPGEPASTAQQSAAVDNQPFDVTAYLKSDEAPLALEQPPEGDTETNFVIGVVEEPEAAPAAEALTAPLEATAPAPVTRTQDPAPVLQPTVAAPKPEPAKKVRVTEYWIQAGSFSQRSSAEQAKASLQEKDFDSVIFTKLVDGTEYFRVRIGPYKYKAEAEKFLSYVKNIQTFEKSQIYEVYVEKTL